MTTVITTNQDSRVFNWCVSFRAEFFGDEEKMLDEEFYKIKNEVNERRRSEEAKLTKQREALRWWQFLKHDKLNEEIQTVRDQYWSDDWLVANHFNGFLKEKGYTKVDKKISRDGSSTCTIEKWEKA